MTLIVTPKNKKEEKVLKAFLNSLAIGFHSEADEDTALVNAMKEGKQSALLNKSEQLALIRRLKTAK